MNNLEQYQTDHLFLLVGTNPLPNYVASLLLASESGTLHLLHSGGKHGTVEVAERLKNAIEKRKPQLKASLWEINEAKSHLILQQMRDAIRNMSSDATVGLNYTGGTKAMAVHVYRAIEKAFSCSVFSYLDARTLSIVIDGRNEPIKVIPEEKDLTLNLAQLFSLHGYSLPNVRKNPFQPKLCQALAVVHSKKDSLQEWQNWCREIESCPSLPDISKYRSLEKVSKAFDDLCGQAATPDLVARCLGHEHLVQCSKWLIGEWLEEYTLWAISELAKKCCINDYSINIEPQRRGSDKFQLDVAAVKGYQLFAISCMASKEKPKCKEHLLEVYVRARQIGGDEARIGLVCCYPDPSALQDEINETWFTEGRIRVFGMNDLIDLPDRLQEWFITANDAKNS
jgi:hypothetical protein